MLAEQKDKAEAVEAFTILREEALQTSLHPSAGEETETQKDPVTPKSVYGALVEQNSDMVAWIRIEGTPIDYPVMQTPDDGEFYLNHGFEKKSSAYGVPFADKVCDLSPEGGNIIIYGHNMKDGEMFASLLYYKEQSYFRDHPVIRFDTLEEFGRYQIVAVLKTNATVGVPQAFDFTRTAAFSDEEEFNSFIDKCQKLALYPTGESVQPEDRLLILSTCEYSSKNGRLVIVAKRMPV